MEQEKRKKRSYPGEDEPEETMTYKARKSAEDLNAHARTFDSAFAKGINSAESVFGRTAVFKPKQ